MLRVPQTLPTNDHGRGSILSGATHTSLQLNTRAITVLACVRTVSARARAHVYRPSPGRADRTRRAHRSGRQHRRRLCRHVADRIRTRRRRRRGVTQSEATLAVSEDSSRWLFSSDWTQQPPAPPQPDMETGTASEGNGTEDGQQNEFHPLPHRLL